MSLSIRPASITKIVPDSIAAEIGFEVGDAIVAINGTRPRDLIDYKFLCADDVLELEVLDVTGKTHHVEIEKDYDEDLGLEFATALFDGLIQCNNHCPFCFIDQQPPGKRSSLYFKDDDYRLSFLYGSYLTLTNLSQREWQRIEQMRLSPLYVSVHATDPEVRIRLLKNPRAGQILDQIKWFQKKRLQIHAQVVLCPGINDSIQLEKTLRDLASYHTGEVPAVASVAVVPVGLTRFRLSVDELTPVTRSIAVEVISQVRSLSKEFRQQFGSTFAWLADEWFLIAGEELPDESEYEDYPQIDNGVGSIHLFIKQFVTAAQKLLPSKVKTRKLTWVVGNAVEQAFQPILKRLNLVEGLEVNMRALNSDYWGQSITVTGLLTGHDLLLNLQGQDLGDGILLPSIMLKHDESVFLDDISIEEVAGKLNTTIFPVAGVEELIKTCIKS
ncbi:MAG: TIGR03279 family radical SAM protein [Rhizonema sp. NSF051]|nr:TIGR03279 family radical SAM protein [Rhizonema sp. NSF051]